MSPNAHRSLSAFVLFGALLFSASAFALPQFALRSARDCATCHVDPQGWTDPEVELRKCTYDCMSCHVSPSGAGMRNQAGRYYGNEVLPMFGPRQSEEYHASQEVIGAIGAVCPEPSRTFSLIVSTATNNWEKASTLV